MTVCSGGQKFEPFFLLTKQKKLKESAEEEKNEKNNFT